MKKSFLFRSAVLAGAIMLGSQAYHINASPILRLLVQRAISVATGTLAGVVGAEVVASSGTLSGPESIAAFLGAIGALGSDSFIERVESAQTKRRARKGVQSLQELEVAIGKSPKRPIRIASHIPLKNIFAASWLEEDRARLETVRRLDIATLTAHCPEHVVDAQLKLTWRAQDSKGDAIPGWLKKNGVYCWYEATKEKEVPGIFVVDQRKWPEACYFISFGAVYQTKSD